MSLCAFCGVQLFASANLCAHHAAAHADGWAAGNRILCDFVHRGIIPPRLSAADRADVSAHAQEAA